MPGRWDLSGKLPRSRPPSSPYQPGSTRCLSRRPHRSERRLGANGSPPPIGSHEKRWRTRPQNKNIATRSLQDRDMPIDKLVQHIKGDIDNDQAGQIAESFLNSLEEVPPKLVVLPKRHDVALRIEGLDVVGVRCAPRHETTVASPWSKETPSGRPTTRRPRQRRVGESSSRLESSAPPSSRPFRRTRTSTGRCPSRPARGSDRAQPWHRNCHHRK